VPFFVSFCEVHNPEMKATRYQTDKRLWAWIALTLFVICWCFVPWSFVKPDSSFLPIVLLCRLVVAFFHGDIPFRGVFVVGIMLAPFAFISGMASVVTAWFLQCIVVIARSKFGKGKISN
jgi:hypothetical protein